MRSPAIRPSLAGTGRTGVETIETDYLVVGAGAMGMAFTDTLVAETDARVVLVDRGMALRRKAGSHATHVRPADGQT